MSMETSSVGSMRTTSPSHARLTRMFETPCSLDVPPVGRSGRELLDIAADGTFRRGGAGQGGRRGDGVDLRAMWVVRAVGAGPL
ncbi:hypothetical protein GCM10009864_40220 [Streptomyces lunalinharesii]|uniref:Uncharacterized protein n=1 Tax=Streptomyces lunalinharesii TaxID=333384 RepID=A0ABN3S2V1_9ACTN